MTGSHEVRGSIPLNSTKILLPIFRIPGAPHPEGLIIIPQSRCVASSVAVNTRERIPDESSIYLFYTIETVNVLISH